MRRAVHVSGGTELRPGRVGPVGLEEGTGDIGYLQVVLGQNLLHFGDLRIAQIHGVLVPCGAKLDPTQAEVVRDDVTDVVKVLRDLIVDDGDFEWGRAGGKGRGSHTRTPEKTTS